ncbi:MAG: 50S ribosomal protein L18 [Deltaproteobacteria bacterium GWC2_42_51]|nr:MAG: 50S ribosomal protein L18 [Deltaproteobacteria bacterium GWA2_42_85]OGP26709.1 MAG: 50S ribosomal protein L18 [Deltaproteobacteria bacterium GWB2_42_7]OGP32698.1 MAG: 50S ribosomal protein L18 [Deltaproteobacteria bacterium GWC2_42_51]OGP39112.1 MAG: 50S ribosomal protein L18 [Deltaproteobacteria bacterium GWD2_42_10]OGP47954.1 MAG: 50S ribosomal protein L18 [Deltaproteobacteria bacterium GWF2_42_12]OGQ24783.1 MAG: 50S ribosomal protein L18 [Deltaproteobacteria bacterium RIFCSPHIGHO2_0
MGIEKRIEGYLKRKKRVRKKIWGTSERPRLSIFRSNKHIYAQIIEDASGKTLISTSTISKELQDKLKKKTKKTEAAKKIGELVAKKAISKGIDKVVFDRGGFIYHGRIKAVADGAREAGLKF